IFWPASSNTRAVFFWSDCGVRVRLIFMAAGRKETNRQVAGAGWLKQGRNGDYDAQKLVDQQVRSGARRHGADTARSGPMPPVLKEFLQAFIPLFVAIDPIGLAAVFLGLGRGVLPAQRQKIARQATLTGGLVALLFL